ncbi:hypothetical protein LSTR_LSTR002644 [Laodelphax striatellus]|uniref:Uncharacterized protein n=1 Tax=Laodelphax striatellus TaxID=195883 RepID=A0A482X5P3_LAOST|nr:hypothetical protein LSTR_LSTR002644 [Laodelphax striatellus]
MYIMMDPTETMFGTADKELNILRKFTFPSARISYFHQWNIAGQVNSSLLSRAGSWRDS